MKIRGLAVAICLALVPCIHAESFTTNIVNAIETNAGPRFALGATGPYNFLLVTNGGRLTNGTSIVGDASGADNNVAIVTGANSVWRSINSFLLGNTGALNQVSVLDGARLISAVITVGAASSSNQLNIRDGFVTDGYPNAAGMMIGGRRNANFNVVTLDGPRARGTNDRTFVGFEGASNSLVILNGAEFTVGGASAAPEFVVGAGEFSDGNFVEISGAGSKLIATVPFTLGDSGSGNRLLVDGARLQTFTTQIGSACRSHNNAALIRGTGTVWTNGALDLGFCSTSNSLTITDGAQVLAGRVRSSVQGGGQNRIEVSGAGSLLRAENLALGNSGSADLLIITDGGRVAGRIDQLGLAGSNNFALVSGVGSSWSNSSLEIGGGNRNALRVGEGGSVQTGWLLLGTGFKSMLNSAGIVGPATRLTAGTVGLGGESGYSNRLVVSAGATVSSHNIYVGSDPRVPPGAISHFNLLSVIGNNSIVMVESNVVIGFEGHSNRLELLDGAQIHSARAGIIGERPGLRNSALVSGHRSVWFMTNELIIGEWAWSSSLVISNGGFVRSQSGHLGTIGQPVGEGSRCPYRGSFSRVHVTGHNSLWAIADSLVVGGNAILNSLVITNGGRVLTRQVTIGLTHGGWLSGGCGGTGSGVPFLNEIELAGGNLDLDMNAVNTFEVRYGTLRLRSGAVSAGRLLMTNQWSRLELLGGSLTCSEAVVDNLLPLIIGDGLHNASFHGGDIAAPRGIIVREHAMLESGGRITADVTNSGTLSPSIFGTLVIASNFVQQPAGTLMIDIGLQRAEALIVSNAADLNGRLLLRQDAGIPSNTVAIITAAAVTGTFSNATNGARLKTTDNLGSFVVEYTPTSVTLRDYQSTDLDGDGIEDAWATRHFGHSPLTPAEKAADEDGDGASNYDEFVAGTDPENSASVLRASISYTNGAATLVFPCREGKQYRIVWSSVLAAWSSGMAEWHFILDPTFSFPEPGLCRWTEDGRWGGLGGAARFFRVEAMR